jgi:hypothetical protein
VSATRFKDAPKPLAVAIELEDRRVVKHQNLLLRVAPQPSLFAVRSMHGIERDVVGAQETIETLQLSLRRHGLGETEPGVSSQLHPNPLQSLAAPAVPEHSTTEFHPDVLEAHRAALITFGWKTRSRCVGSLAGGLVTAKGLASPLDARITLALPTRLLSYHLRSGPSIDVDRDQRRRR